MHTECDEYRRQIDQLLNLPQQMWLLGAGISKDVGIPLMSPLTDQVESCLEDQDQKDFRNVRELLPENAHVEHVLSHIGDLIAIAARSREKTVTLGSVSRSFDEFQQLHARIQQAIRDTIRYGCFPAERGKPARVGTSDEPIVTVDNHVDFVKALFRHRRAGLERRPPICFFTTNYDTLLEDALALCRVATFDGFCGGAMAYWEPGRGTYSMENPFEAVFGCEARVVKLHGSIDWYVSDEDTVVRRREGAGYPADEPGRLLIYPQATKYQVTQRDPYASLFASFRAALSHPNPGLLCICGYSFGDDHINEEIERALRHRGNRLTVLAFCCQPDDKNLGSDEGLPECLARWLRVVGAEWKDRIIVAGRRGVYHGGLANRCPASAKTPHDWWTFQGLTNLLEKGPGVTV